MIYDPEDHRYSLPKQQFYIGLVFAAIGLLGFVLSHL
jgi:hypothetical protein